MADKKSIVLAFMHERIENLEYYEPVEPEKKVTVRLIESVVDSLDAIAAKLSMTRTSCAEQLLSLTINEAATYVIEDPVVAARKSFDPAILTKIEDEQEVAA